MGQPESQDLLADQRITDYGLLAEAYHYLEQRFDERLEEHDAVSGGVFEVLLRLARTPGQRLKMSDLANQLLITGGGATRLVDRVVKAGYVDKAPSTTDRRIQWVSLTPQGQTAINNAIEIHLQDLQREIFDRLTPAETNTLRTILDRLRYPPDTAT